MAVTAVQAVLPTPAMSSVNQVLRVVPAEPEEMVARSGMEATAGPEVMLQAALRLSTPAVPVLAAVWAVRAVTVVWVVRSRATVATAAPVAAVALVGPEELVATAPRESLASITVLAAMPSLVVSAAPVVPVVWAATPVALLPVEPGTSE
jgi:hypothetical protein